jgi:phage terminase small subunit
MSILPNQKHEAVALAYIADPEKVGWRAYRKVYPKSSRHTAENCFSRLMKKEEFVARVAELSKEAAQGAVMTAQAVLEELTKLARANMQDFVGDDDVTLSIASLDQSRAAAVQEYTVEHYVEGHGEDAKQVKKIKLKLADKLRSLELLGKHFSLFTERHVHELGGVAERLAAALARADERADDNARPDRRRLANSRETARMDGAAGDPRKRARWAR